MVIKPGCKDRRAPERSGAQRAGAERRAVNSAAERRRGAAAQSTRAP